MAAWTAVSGLLLMITVTVSPAEGETPFAVNVTQDVYEAEEDGKVILTWFFPVSSHTEPHSLVIQLLRDKPRRLVYLFVRGAEVSQHVDQIYRGRFSCNKELFAKGRIECVFANVTLNDTGIYICEVSTDRKVALKACRLDVAAASHHPEPDQPEPRGRIGIVIGSGLLVAAALLYSCYWRVALCCWVHRSRDLKTSRFVSRTADSLRCKGDVYL